MLKKFVGLVVGASMVLTMMGVSAATQADVATVTSYSGNADTVKVTTTVANAVAGTNYTYLVHDADKALNEILGANIVHIDQQKPETDGTITFAYETASKNVGASVRVGGLTDAVATGEVDGVTKAVALTLGANAATEALVDIAGAVADDFVLVPFDATGYSVTGVTINGVAADYFPAINGVWVKCSAVNVTGDVAVVVAAEQQAATGAVSFGAGYLAADSAIMAVGQIDGAATEFGIAFSKDNATYKNLSALGAGSKGHYAIKVTNYNAITELADATTVYAKAYCVVDGQTKYGAVYSFNVGGSADVKGEKVQ